MTTRSAARALRSARGGDDEDDDAAAAAATGAAISLASSTSPRDALRHRHVRHDDAGDGGGGDDGGRRDAAAATRRRRGGAPLAAWRKALVCVFLLYALACWTGVFKASDPVMWTCLAETFSFLVTYPRRRPRVVAAIAEALPLALATLLYSMSGVLSDLLFGEHARYEFALWLSVRCWRVDELLGASLHIDKALHAWFVARPELWAVSKQIYHICHLPFAATLIYVYSMFFSPSKSRFVWRTYTFSMLLFSVICILFPCAPPRMMTSLGFIDVGFFDDFRAYETRRVVVNRLAALPSHHAMWQAITAVFACLAVRGWRPAARYAVYALAVAFVVINHALLIATANHYLIDILCGYLLGALMFYVAQRYSKYMGDASIDEDFEHYDAWLDDADDVVDDDDNDNDHHKKDE